MKKNQIKTIKIEPHTISFARYWINGKPHTYSEKYGVLERLLIELCPQHSHKIQNIFMRHVPVFADIKKGIVEEIRPDLDAERKQYREEMRRKMFFLPNVEREVKSQREFKQKTFKDEFRKSDNFFKKLFKRN